ncbi:glycosyltransferase family 1 protein [Pseudalkalibacillus sp. SCS-8]|uniref:glycosyltransferase family 4 protein n=1 Tax=Pseudalkalibacillus nanhaiensis TaxID=3115291 RepID=UPI0032D9E263
MKIALFSDTYYPQVNGVANTLHRLVSYWERQGIDCKVIVPKSGTTEDLYASQTHSLPSMRFLLYKECRVALPYNRGVTQELLAFQPDLIHVATPFSTGLFGMNHGKKYGVPMVASYHTNFDHYLSYYHLQWATNWLWKYLHWFHSNFDQTYVPSHDTLDHLTKKGFDKLSIWGRGVDTALYHPGRCSDEFKKKYNIPGTHLLLTYVGRLAPEKDIETFINIIRTFPKEWQDQVSWMIVGEGPSEEVMKETLHSYSNVRFTGYLRGEELSQAYRASDLFIFPSPTETFGNVVLESMACGTPVIGADSGGVRTIIQDGTNGYLVTPGRSQAFIDRILFLLKHPKILKRFGKMSREYALSQSWNTIFAKLTKEYMEIAERKKRIHSAS